MSQPSEQRTRLTILGGFLGSGKTTWLRHQLHHGQMRDALVIVNEAADVSVDTTLLFNSSTMIALAGGCACCVGKENLIRTLREFCDARVAQNNDDHIIEHIVLETSGLADPGPIVEAIRADPVLVYHILLDEIVVVVDGVHGAEYLCSEPLGRRQVETADRLIITKTDTVDKDSLCHLHATLLQLNPGAEVSGSEMGSVCSLPEFDHEAGIALPVLANDDDRAVLSTTLDLDESIDWTAFTVWLSALLHARGDDIIRVKGIVQTPSGRLLLQSVRKIVQSPEILPVKRTECDNDNSIVFIGRGFKPEEIRQSLDFFAGNREHCDNTVADARNTIQ